MSRGPDVSPFPSGGVPGAAGLRAGPSRDERGVAPYQRFQNTDAEGWKRYTDNLRGQSVIGAVNILRSVHWNRRSLWNDRERLAKLNRPVLLVFGNEDFYLVSETNHFLHETLPNSVLKEFKPNGHLVHIEQASKFNRVFQEFLDTVPPFRAGGVTTQ